MDTGSIKKTTTQPMQPGRADAADAAKNIRQAKGDASAAKGNAGAAENFNVQLSPAAKQRAAEQAKALDIARNTPDVRENRVMDLKKRIQDGTYKVEADKVADGMLREAILEHLAQTEEV
jgi:negative regulator of flagellin synthesis FlgM